MVFLWISGSVALLCLSMALAESVPVPPKYGSSYEINATIYLPYAEIVEPIHAIYQWRSQRDQRSRVDYYGGVMTELDTRTGYFLPNGAHYIFAPITNKQVYNKQMCFQHNGTNPYNVQPIDVLPDLTNFQFVSSSVHKNKSVNVFQLKQVNGKKLNTYTFMSDNHTNMPVFYEMMGYDSLLGSHYDKYYVEYESIKMPRIFQDADFEPPKGMKCQPFPSPPDNDLDHISHSPIREFIQHEQHHVDNAFEAFKKTHGKSYSEAEHVSRKHIFRQNYRYINSKNRAGLSFTLKVNHMSDKSEKEMKMMRGYRYSAGNRGGQSFFAKSMKTNNVPDQWDWRLIGAVTPVKDQAICGSCWSFGTTGTIEGAYYLKTKNLTRFSQQELVDCSWGFGNDGCDGGEQVQAYKWITDNGGLSSEEKYGSYLAIDSRCKKNDVLPVVQLKNYTCLPSGDLNALKIALYNKGPISVAIDASHKSFGFYSNGIYYEPNCRNDTNGLDHAVLAVGYGTLNGENYWLVKNSWSTFWGDDGYVLMSQKNNNCGVATAASYVAIAEVP